MTLRPLLSLLAALAVAPLALRAQPTPASAPEGLTETVIECAGLSETVSTVDETIATFRDKVVVTASNLRLTCDFLRVVTSRKGDPKAIIGKQSYFKSLVATGNVRLVQGDREATCGRAEIFPNEDRVVLSRESKAEPHPSITFNKTSVMTGPRMILYRGERRAVIEPEDGVGVRFTGPSIKDLGFDKPKTAAPAAGSTSAPATITVPGITPPPASATPETPKQPE
jgi:lipopolysaccharide export system protein LptA